eukprot:4919986-Amphidinium_carterae.1
MTSKGSPTVSSLSSTKYTRYSSHKHIQARNAQIVGTPQHSRNHPRMPVVFAYDRSRLGNEFC